MYWTRDDARFVRSWLVAGPFAATSSRESVTSPSENPNRPTEGALLKLADGSSAPWRRHDSWGDTNNLDFREKAVGPRLAYAWTRVLRTRGGRALLSLGSDEGLCAWVNGRKVFSREGRRPYSPDADQIEIELNEGENDLLLEVSREKGAGLFSARVLETGSILPRPLEIYPALCDGPSESLSLQTDNGKVDLSGAPVTVDLLAPGGVVLASKTAARGARVTFDVASLPEGPYELRCATINFEKREYLAYVNWYKGDCLARARELASAAASAADDSPLGLSLRMLVEMVDHNLGSKLADAGGNPWEKIHSPLMEFEELRLEDQGRPSRVRPHGFVRFAYLDPVDGAPQFCRAYLPSGYDPEKRWPLVVNLHGSHPQNPPYVGWWSVDVRHPGPGLALPSGQGYVLLEPHGRGNNEYQYLGVAKDDFLRCIAEARRRFNIDPDRVYLIGSSMGGWGAWRFASENPDLFAAIEPIFGGSDYHSEMSEESLAKLDETDRFLAERRSSWAMAENLLHMPILVQHGDSDKSVAVDYSRWGVRFLQRWGFDVRYHEYPGRGHEDMIDDASAAKNMEWLLAQRRDPDPRHVRLRSADLKHASAYWVRVEQIASPLAFASVDAEIVGLNRVRLDTDKVLDITLEPRGSLIDPSRPLVVVWNGVRREAPLASGRLRLTETNYTPSALHKNPRRAGSMQDFACAPFAIVVGTASPDPAMVEACRLKASAVADAWRAWQHAEPRLFSDTEIADGDLARYSLLLVGGPGENRIAAKYASSVPLRIGKDRVAVDGRDYEARDAYVQLLYPHPENEERYLLIVAANSVAGMNSCQLGLRELPSWDYVVGDGSVPAYGTWVSDHRLRVVSGCFDRNWRYDAALSREGDASIRSAARRVRYRDQSGIPLFGNVDAYLGRYQIGEGQVFEMVSGDSSLWIQGPGLRAEMLPLSDTEFWLPAIGAQLRAQFGPDGKFTGFECSVAGNDRYMKISKL